MRIFRYWHICTEKNGELTVHFKAGSNESLEDAVSLAEEKRKVWRCCYEQLPGALEAAAALRAKLKGGAENEYEAPICEEIIETIDSANIITRNRYGALVLNSTDCAFLDIDFNASLPFPGFKVWFKELFSGKRKSAEEKIREHIISIINEKYPFRSFRLYRTAGGFRLLTDARKSANSPESAGMMTDFCCDPLYATLCGRQNCFRARLTPKPRRIKVKTALKFKFPCSEEETQEKERWLELYGERSKGFRSCVLIKTFGPEMNSAAVQRHDELCRCSAELPLA
ncbi:MAG: hypothetical protein IJV93_08355 [Lentisphaeria bacterium]|nr:hypothetical protein [Lentisphaeria bacterium]